MARKARRNPRRKSAGGNSPPETLALDVEGHLGAGRYRDAVEGYKRLLKLEQRDEWIEGLARAYAGRAEELAAKGMVKEAVALWRNRATGCSMPLADPRYFGWLLRVGKAAEAASLYREQGDRLGDPARVRERLAARALLDGEPLISRLVADDPVVVDYPAADEAVAACARGDRDGLESALKRIPFRSPYRDLRPLLKGLIRARDAGGSTVAAYRSRFSVCAARGRGAGGERARPGGRGSFAGVAAGGETARGGPQGMA